MTTGNGTSENFGTLINLAVLFLLSIWIYSGTSLSLLCKDPSSEINTKDSDRMSYLNPREALDYGVIDRILTSLKDLPNQI